MCQKVELFHGMKNNLRWTDQDFHVKNDVVYHSWKSKSAAECERFIDGLV